MDNNNNNNNNNNHKYSTFLEEDKSRKKFGKIRSQNDYCISSRNCKSEENGFLL